MANISFRHVDKIYPGGVKVIENLNLEIADKEFVVLVGPSGCGKSTTLRMIAGLEEVSGGELYIGEKCVNDVHPKDRDIAMVFQNYALYPHMTVYKNLAFALTLRKVDKKIIDQKVHQAAKILDIEHLLDRKPKALSGGQRQRVALGRAMVRDPAVFLLDEPLSNLDAKLRTQMRTEITKLHKKLDTTFVYVTHDQTEAMTMGDRIVVMKDGVIQQADTPQMLYDYPCNMFVAGFIGSPKMNFLDAVLEKSAQGYQLKLGDNTIPIPLGRGGDVAYAAYVGKEVVLGVRPEHFHAEPAFLAASQETTVELEVDLVELLGSEIYLYGKCCGANQVTVRTPSRVQTHAGDRIRLAIDMNKIHLFSKETERTISV